MKRPTMRAGLSMKTMTMRAGLSMKTPTPTMRAGIIHRRHPT